MKDWKDWLAVILSVLALGGTFYRTGAFTNSVSTLVDKVSKLAERVEGLEKGATKGADRHITEDDGRDARAAAQLSEQQKQISSLLKMEGKIAETAAKQDGANDLIKYKLDVLAKALEKHVEDKKP